jgi:hypothetical protein
MGLTNSDQLADQVEIEATIDDNQFLTISKVLYKATVNEPRSVTIQVSDKESLLKARLGAVLKLKIGRGDTIHNLDFEGIVKVIKPGNQTHTIVAMDRITSLATSEFRDFKQSDIVGQSKTDANIFVTLNDESSINQYGPSSTLVTLDTVNRGILENTAYEILQAFSTPTVSYAITMHNAEWVGLGDLVQLDVPMLEKDVILPVVAYETEIGDSLVTKLTLGEPELNLKDFVRQLQL